MLAVPANSGELEPEFVTEQYLDFIEESLKKDENAALGDEEAAPVKEETAPTRARAALTKTPNFYPLPVIKEATEREAVEAAAAALSAKAAAA